MMIKKLEANRHKISTLNRDEIMQIFLAAWNNGEAAFKRNGITSKLDVKENYFVSSKLKELVWEEIRSFAQNCLIFVHVKSLKQLEAKILPPHGVKRKVEATVNGVPRDEACEIFDGIETSDESEDES